MKTAPRVSIGLPVYNGEKYLAESLDALLGQTYENFELIISDNASTDDTAGICHRYMKQDSRIRYICQPRNIGATPNHNFVVEQARGELIKWAAADDLYARNLLECCVDALDEYPHVMLAHSWTALIDDTSAVTQKIEYPLATASMRAPERFRSMLNGKSGDDFYGLVGPRSSAAQCPKVVSTIRTTRWSPKSPCTGRSIRTRTGCSSGVIILTGPSGHVPRHGPDARIWIHAGQTGCGTRSSGSTPNTCGDTSRPSGMPRCRARTGRSVIATWRYGRLAVLCRGVPDGTGSRDPARSGHHYCEPPPSHSPSARPDRRFPNADFHAANRASG